MQRDQQYAAVVDASEAGLEKVDQRNLQFAESNGLDFHVRLLQSGVWSIRPVFVPPAEQEAAIALRIALVAQT